MKEEDKLIIELNKLIHKTNLEDFEELNDIINDVGKKVEEIKEN